MRIPLRTLAVAILFACLHLAARAQSPRVYLKFDNNLNDSSSTGIITSVVPVSGWTPTYTTDRNGVANGALVVSGSQSLQLAASSLVGNSNQALGLRNASGTNTSFTLVAWVYFNGVGSGQGYNTIFGNLGSGTGTLHAGLNTNSDKAHFGFDSNDVTGATAAMVANVWYHLAFVYDTTAPSGPVQRIYVNGVPEVTRTAVTDTIKVADLYLGNWGTANDASNDLRGRLDEVAVYNTALKADQIQALFNGVAANALSAAGTYSGPKLPGVLGGAGTWGVREIKGYPGIAYGTLVNADRIIRAYATAPSGTVAEYQAPVINMLDDEGAGNAGYFTNEADFGTNTPADDNSFLMIAKCAVRIPVEDDYTFGFRGDDGSRLRVLGKQFVSSTRIYTGNVADPAHNGDGICVPNGTGDSNTIGVVHLTPGDYNLELTYWEGSGGSSIEVFAARGAKTSVDATFQLVGNTAAGGLEIVRDPDTLPQIQSFTVNNGSSLFVNGGVPSSFTLAWQTNSVPTSVSISPGIGTVSQSGSQVIASPAMTTTYTLTASNGADVATKNVTVYVDSPPAISSFTASDTTVTAGAAVVLNWAVDGATSLTLQPGNINVTGQTTRTVNPASTTTYTLVATNQSGSSQQQITVQVGLPPAINSFTVADANPLFGAETSLSWNVNNADSLAISPGVGAISGATGSVSIFPLQSTTYTLTATNAFGTSTATASVNQPTPIGVTSAGFTARRVNSSVAFPFSGQGYLQSALSLLGGQNLSSETTQSGYATVNFTDGADGDFTTGNSAFPGGSGDNFAVRITATLVVNTPGEYTFVVNCDDGARLRIDGQDVIVDDGTHSPGGNSGRVTLTNPTSQLELIYYDATGGAEVELGWIRPNLSWQLLTTITPAAPIVRGQVLISEFMADNKNTLADEDGASSDWIEIWNSTNASANLAGYYLTDDPAILNKWAFPAWSLNANQYLIAFASQKDRKPNQAVPGVDNPGTVAQPRLHTNFKLASTGGYLFLTKDNGAGGYTIVSAFNPYPPQKEDVSYGSSDAEGYVGYMETPTPGVTNGATVVDFVKDTKFDHARGRYNAPFTLAISTTTPDATIRYTTNGSTPTVNSGLIYTGPISINGTTTVRAAAFKAGWKPTNVDTESYLFIDDIATQTNNTALAAGFPSGSVNGQVFRYGLGLSAVTAGGGTLQSLKNALAAAPSVCLTTDIPNLIDPNTGIYVNPAKHGLFWERPVSMEYINALGTSEFQIDCGFRIRGGASRAATNAKHAFHMFFRNLYSGDLNYRLFGTAGASDFSQIDLRCEENYSWSKDNSTQNTLIREEWSRASQRDMGQPYGRNSYFHLYINGIYWGVYDFEERTEAAYGETYLGGTKDFVDTVKSAGSSGSYNTEMTDGNFAAWRTLYDQCLALKNDATESGRTAKYMQLQGLNPDGSRNPAYPVLLDPDNLIDYLLIVFYDGSFDSPMSTFLNNASNNWFAVRDRLGTRGFTYFAHDQEHGMDSAGNNSYNRIGPWGDPNATGNNWGQTWTTSQYRTRETFTKFNPQYVHEFLAYSAEYRIHFADRVQRHFFNGGALTTTKSVARVNELAAQVDPIIHAEAARWGSTSLNRNTWLTAKNAVLTFINSGGSVPSTHPALTPGDRTSIVFQELKGYTDNGAKPLYPTLSAPTFSGQFGGSVPNPYSMQISNPSGTGAIYYTTNGTDPRAIGGAIASGALTGASPISLSLTATTTLRARIYDSATQTWSAMTEAEYLVGTLASAANLVISKIHYNPPSSTDLEEYVELMNIGATTIDLTNVHFTLGIQFQFPDGYLLAPGARVLVVRDTTAFSAAFPSVPAGQIVGIFANSTSLDNGGERLQLVDAANNVIRDFSYGDSFPWPSGPDGNGPALVLKRPTSNPDHSIADNWRSSYTVGGSPGQDDALTYANWMTANGVNDPNGTADLDGDGFVDLMEYALGTNPQSSSWSSAPSASVQTFVVNSVAGDYLTLTYQRPTNRDDVSYTVEGSVDLSTWVPAVQVGSPSFDVSGFETVTSRYPQIRSTSPQQFLRLKVTKLP